MLPKTRRSSRPKKKSKPSSTRSKDARRTESSESKSKDRRSKKPLWREQDSRKRSRWPSRKLGEPKRLKRKSTELRPDKRERRSKPRKSKASPRLPKVLPPRRRRESSPTFDQRRIMLIPGPQDISKMPLSKWTGRSLSPSRSEELTVRPARTHRPGKSKPTESSSDSEVNWQCKPPTAKRLNRG